MDWWEHIEATPKRAISYLDLTFNPAHEARATQVLSESELARASRFVYQQHCREYCLTRAGLKLLLAEAIQCGVTDLTIQTDPNGKPFAECKGCVVDMEFNVSHTDGHGMIALTRFGRIGVDIQHRNLKTTAERSLQRVFSSDEKQLLSTTKKEQKHIMLLRIWTIKEAVIKALGEGFRYDTTSFSVPEQLLFGEAEAIMNLPNDPSTQWQLLNLENEHYAAACAHELIG